jgi:hypothetical protein
MAFLLERRNEVWNERSRIAAGALRAASRALFCLTVPQRDRAARPQTSEIIAIRVRMFAGLPYFSLASAAIKSHQRFGQHDCYGSTT